MVVRVDDVCNNFVKKYRPFTFLSLKMRSTQVLVSQRFLGIIYLLAFYFSHSVDGYTRYTINENSFSFMQPDIVTLDRVRFKRDVPPPPTTTETTVVVNLTTEASARSNNTDDSNRTVKLASTTSAPVSVTQIPLLGQNGTGILRVNLTGNIPKVSEPIYPDDNFTDVWETPDQFKTQQNITDLKIDTHSFYNSTFINNRTYFDGYWAKINTAEADVHAILSNSHRRATTLTLGFDFPFYGHGIRNITVATGGFIYTGDHVHQWLAATQYIAPLMANFDTTLTNDSFVKMFNEADKFIAIWENVTLQEDPTKKFTFSVTLYKNGDIDFAYKDVPIPVQNISDSEHPVKVGISDAYHNDRIFFLIRRKTIYEYHRASFKGYEIASGTIMKLTALPTCLQYDSCDSCVNHDTGFDCMWCEAIHKCSSGTDRHKQDWMLRNCDKEGNHATNESQCPASADTGNTAYVIDVDSKPRHSAVVNTMNTEPKSEDRPIVGAPPVHASVVDTAAPVQHSALGGAVGAFVAIALVCSAAAWTLYAFKNPHTRSGQLLIKYRPSQWSWRRGEARYTAATIHM